MFSNLAFVQGMPGSGDDGGGLFGKIKNIFGADEGTPREGFAGGMGGTARRQPAGMPPPPGYAQPYGPPPQHMPYGQQPPPLGGLYPDSTGAPSPPQAYPPHDPPSMAHPFLPEQQQYSPMVADNGGGMGQPAAYPDPYRQPVDPYSMLPPLEVESLMAPEPQILMVSRCARIFVRRHIIYIVSILARFNCRWKTAWCSFPDRGNSTKRRPKWPAEAPPNCRSSPTSSTL